MAWTVTVALPLLPSLGVTNPLDPAQSLQGGAKYLREQLDQVAHVTLLGLNHPVATGLAEDLATLTNGALPRCFFTDNGSNAIEVALKLSFQYWQLVGQDAKRGVISMEGAYHGDTFGTMAVGEWMKRMGLSGCLSSSICSACR